VTKIALDRLEQWLGGAGPFWQLGYVSVVSSDVFREDLALAVKLARLKLLETKKMTDLDKWKQFLTQFSIPFEETTDVSDLRQTQWEAQALPEDDQRIGLKLSPSEDSCVTGYVMFFTVIEFHISGKFLRISIWE
jgi:hypothetical protein